MPNYFSEWRLFRCFSNFRSTNDVPNAVFNPMNFYQATATADKFQWPVSLGARASMAVNSPPRIVAKKKKRNLLRARLIPRDNYLDFSRTGREPG